MKDEIRAKLDAVFKRRNSGWQGIGTAPRDGTVVELTWMENGNAQEIWPCQWCHIQRNGLFPGTDLNNTHRACKKCRLVRVTRHEPENHPQHWIEFHRDGTRIDVDGKTPACEPVMAPA